MQGNNIDAQAKKIMIIEEQWCYIEMLYIQNEQHEMLNYLINVLDFYKNLCLTNNKNIRQILDENYRTSS